jgi:hypothetical protein
MTNTTDWIERLLREDAARGVPDGGFTRRVMGTLPPREARGISLWWKPALIMGSAALGGGLAAFFAGTSLPQGFIDIVQMRGLTQAALTGLAMCAAMVVSALVLAADV